MFASDYPLLTHERCMREARALPFRDSERFAEFLATNAQEAVLWLLTHVQHQRVRKRSSLAEW